MSEEHKQKISAANKGKKRTPEQIGRLRERMRGRVNSAEHRKKVGDALRGRKRPQHVIDSMIRANTGRKMPMQVKEALSKANKGRIFSEEHLEKLRITSTGRPKSEETLAKMRGRKMSEKNKAEIKKRFSKLIMNLETGIFYDSVKEAANCYNISRRNLGRYLSGSRTNKTSLAYA